MGDLNRGETFAAGETVSHTRLHALVDDATIKNSAVTTAKIADGAVTTAKLAGALAVSAGNISLASGKLLGGNGSNVGEAVTVGATLSLSGAELGIASGGVAAAQLASDAVETAKIKDGNVTTAKLAASTGASDGVTFAKMQFVTDARLLGRSAGSNGVPQEISVGTGLTLSSGTLSVSGSALSTYTWTPSGTVSAFTAGSYVSSGSTGLSGIPEVISGFIVANDTDQGFSSGERVPFYATWTNPGSNGRNALSVSGAGSAGYPLTMTRDSGSGVYIKHKTTGTLAAIDETKWEFKVYAIKF